MFSQYVDLWENRFLRYHFCNFPIILAPVYTVLSIFG